VSYAAKTELEMDINQGELIEIMDAKPNANGFVFARTLTRGPNGEIHSGMVPFNCLMHYDLPSSPVTATTDTTGKVIFFFLSFFLSSSSSSFFSSLPFSFFLSFIDKGHESRQGQAEVQEAGEFLEHGASGDQHPCLHGLAHQAGR